MVATGGVQHVVLETAPLRAVIEPGDSLVVQLTSNVFPTLARNRHNGAGEGYFEQFRVAHTTLHHSATAPSSLTLLVE